MTREQIDAIAELYAERSDSLDASSYSIPELCKDALEALELREALEQMFNQPYQGPDVLTFCRRVGDTYFVATRRQRGQTIEILAQGEGSTPLEAINNARRGM